MPREYLPTRLLASHPTSISSPEGTAARRCYLLTSRLDIVYHTNQTHPRLGCRVIVTPELNHRQ